MSLIWRTFSLYSDEKITVWVNNVQLWWVILAPLIYIALIIKVLFIFSFDTLFLILVWTILIRKSLAFITAPLFMKPLKQHKKMDIMSSMLFAEIKSYQLMNPSY